MTGRRPVVRWALRTFAREWRQQLLVIILLTVVSAASTFVITMAYNLASTRDDVFGDAPYRFRTEIERPEDVDRYLADVDAAFERYEAIEHGVVRVGGTAVDIELRALGGGALSGPMLEVLEGRLPRTDSEVAVTDGVLATLGATLGETAALDHDRLVVGIIENPAELSDEHAIVPDVPRPNVVTVLVDGAGEDVRRFRSSHEPGRGFLEERNTDERNLSALLTMVLTTVALLLAGLVAAAGFVVIAHRRQRQLGLLAAVGATTRHLRLVVVSNGAIVGVVTAAAGAVIGLVAWVLFADVFEGVAGHRIPRLSVPWLPVVGSMVLTVLAATAAAWWPARAVSRAPIVHAVSNRPPAPRPALRAALVAVGLAVVGFALIATGNDVANDTGEPLLLLGGVVSMVLCVVMGAGPATSLLGVVAPRLPATVRLALRNVARNRARAGAALAAASMSIGIASAMVIGAAAAEDGVGEGNLAAEQALVFGEVREFPIERVAVPTAEDAAAVARIAARFDASLLALHVPTDDEGDPLVLGFPVSENTIRDAGPVYVATTPVLDHLGISADAGRRLLTYRRGPLHLVGDVERLRFRRDTVPADWIEHIDVPDHSSAPRTLLTETALAEEGWRSTAVGWLLQRAEPWTPADVAALRSEVVAADLGMETRNGQSGLSALRTMAALVGALLALAILAMAVGLVRSEAAADTRTLIAVGASRAARRSIAASTAGALAVLAVLLGTAVAYASLVAGYWTALERMGPPPIAHLGAVLLGVPAVATAASWLLGAREPGVMAPA